LYEAWMATKAAKRAAWRPFMPGWGTIFIYDSVMESFPKTSHDSAYNIAIQGGVRWQFIFA
jgi:hypothetical protein